MGETQGAQKKSLSPRSPRLKGEPKNAIRMSSVSGAPGGTVAVKKKGSTAASKKGSIGALTPPLHLRRAEEPRTYRPLSIFDLKGSLRYRNHGGDGEQDVQQVAWDYNFMKFTGGFPLPLQNTSKQRLGKAIHNDTLYLYKSEIVDYSVLVGIDEERSEIIVGIIDYLREYTWDK